MKNVLKNIGLLGLVLFLSYYTSVFWGKLYDYFEPQYNNSFLNISDEGIFFLVGFPLAYTFFTPLLFKLFGFGRKNVWMVLLLIPPTLLWLLADINNIYLPLILGLIALALAKLIKILISKFRHHNLPMVVNKQN